MGGRAAAGLPVAEEFRAKPWMHENSQEAAQRRPWPARRGGGRGRRLHAWCSTAGAVEDSRERAGHGRTREP